MITTAIIAFREFLEAFLIVGIFLGISGKLQIKKEKEIWIAVITGVALSLLLTSGIYILGERIRGIFTEENADLLGSYLMFISGLFIGYIIFSLHKVFQKSRDNMLIKARQRLQEEAFDISLFFTIVFLVLREGFEIALFTASVSLFSAFVQNFIGLLLGFGVSVLCGLAALYVYNKFPVGKVFKATEYMIILIGASMTQIGITQLLEKYLHFDLSGIFSFYFQFLPNAHTIAGHLLQGFFGIDQEFSLGRLLVMFVYIIAIYIGGKVLYKSTSL